MGFFPSQGANVATIITIAVLSAAGLFTGVNNWTGQQNFQAIVTFNHNADFGTNSSQIFPQNGILLRNLANPTFATQLLAPAVTHNRTLTIPLVTTNDTLATLALPQTFSGNLIFGGTEDFGYLTDKIGSGSLLVRNPASTFTTGLVNSAITHNRTITLPLLTTNETIALQPKTNSTTNSTSQTFTISSAYQMQDSPVFIKPVVTGNILTSFIIGVSDNTINGGCNIQLQYGTWPAPKTGAALTGTTIGLNMTFDSATANEVGVIPIEYTVTGLTQGTSYWIEPAVKAAGAGGTCKLLNELSVVTER